MVATQDRLTSDDSKLARAKPIISDSQDMVGLDDVFEDDEEPMTLVVEDGVATQNPIGYAVDAFTSGIFAALHRAFSRRLGSCRWVSSFCVCVASSCSSLRCLVLPSL